MTETEPTRRSKVYTLDALAEQLEAERAAGRTIAHCHGVFDLLHIGHVRHLAEAKKRADLLVVTVTPDRYVNKGPHRPQFTDTLRAEALAALDSVDFVAINRWPNAVETLRLLKPDFYVKGSDYRKAEDDRTGGIGPEQAAVEAGGGQLVFTDEIVFSSSSLLNRHFSAFPEEVQGYLEGFAGRYSANDVIGWLDAARKLKVLVVGEAIVDEYQFCEAIGKSSKEPMLAVKHLETQRFAGGALAVANHVASFCDDVRLLSMLGERDSHERFVRESLRDNVDPFFLYRSDSPTIVKRRFVEQYFFTKLLSVYEINDDRLSDDDDVRVCAALERLVPQFDVVIVVDFGHEMLSGRAIEVLAEHAKYLAVNTQCNAANQGYHAVSAYRRADFISVAEKEMRLEARDRRGSLREIVSQVSQNLESKQIVVTRGKRGSLAYDRAAGFFDVPAVATKVVDRMGAGDTSLAVSSVLAASGAPMEVVAFVGNVAGAQAVATVGHACYLDRVGLYRHIETLLKI